MCQHISLEDIKRAELHLPLVYDRWCDTASGLIPATNEGEIV